MIREDIQNITRIYFPDDVKISDQFKRLGSEGMFDIKTFMQIVGVLADYLEEREKIDSEKDLEVKVLLDSYQDALTKSLVNTKKPKKNTKKV